jgi:signal transduction histidine kinase
MVSKRFMTLNETVAAGVPLPDHEAHQRTEILLQEFAHLGQKLSAATTREQAARIILKAADRLLGWDCSYLYCYSAEEKRIYPVLIIDIIDGKKTDIPPATGPGPAMPPPIIEKVLQDGAQLILRNELDRSSHGMVPFGDTSRLSASIMIVPIREDNKITGFLSIDSYTYNAYTPANLATLQSLADHCGGALERIGAQEALRESETQLRALAARLQSAREEESIRIAREIHDELGQELTALKMGLSWMERKMSHCTEPDRLLGDKTHEMVKIVSQTLQSVRRITTQLRPRVLDDLGLAAAIEWQTMEFQTRTGIPCESTIDENSLALVREHATAIFRIYQEILTNITRHANATQVAVSMKKVGNSIIFQVRDNGRGITKKEMTGTQSLGLLGMRERALTFGGCIQFESEKKKGTTVTVHIPLASDVETT